MTGSGFDLARLDDEQYQDALDSLGILAVVEGLGQQCREAWDLARRTPGLPEGEGIESVVVAGMGGSGVSGDVARALAEPRLNVPVFVQKGYGPLPEWIGRNTLALAVSYSGNTEETVDALHGLHERGARGVVVSSGGALADLASEFGMPRVAIPGGTQPRAAFGYLALSVIGVLVQVGLLPDLEEDVEEAVKVLEGIVARCARTLPASANPAKALAASIVGKVPLLYGGNSLTAVAAQRFAADINEYAKTRAFANVLPEANHNEICSWESPLEGDDRFLPIFLRDHDEHERVSARFDAMRGILAAGGSQVEEVHAEGRSPLARLLSLVLVTQLAAIYAGFAYGVDPGPVEPINRLKRALPDA